MTGFRILFDVAVVDCRENTGICVCSALSNLLPQNDVACRGGGGGGGGDGGKSGKSGTIFLSLSSKLMVTELLPLSLLLRRRL